MASLTGSFALARERPPSRRPVPLGGKLGGKIVKRRARGVAVAAWVSTSSDSSPLERVLVARCSLGIPWLPVRRRFPGLRDSLSSPISYLGREPGGGPEVPARPLWWAGARLRVTACGRRQ